MLKSIFKFVLCIVCFLLSVSCEKVESSDNFINSFEFLQFNPISAGTIDNQKNHIEVWVPESANIEELAPTIKVSKKASVEPKSGIANDFTGLALYTVIAENGNSRVYTVKVNKSLNSILSFKFKDFSSIVVTIRNDSIFANFPFGTNITSLTPIIEIPAKATVSPQSGVSYDFTKPKDFVVTSENGVPHKYTVVVTKDLGSSSNSLLTIEFPELFLKGTINNQQVQLNVPFGTNLNSVLVNFTMSQYATSNITTNTRVDFSQPKTITITAQNGTPRNYVVTFTTGQQETGIRGVWLTNVASMALNSQSNIANAVKLISDLNFNTIFVVTYNKNQTPYPSQVLKNAVNDINVETEMFPGRNALQELITEAHAKNIKVFGWFEYGFASQYGPGSDGGRGPVLKAHPNWESRDKNGNLAEKSGFYWMNGFHPEVQQFMIDLMVELVTNYDIDGIQGDDRLPSMPVNAGYDDYTVNLYKSEHGGTPPPTNERLLEWMTWRANLLTNFAGRLYDSVKSAKPTAIVAHAPHPYSFSFDEYLQDWPKWLANGKTDIVMPQLYRKEDIGSYNYILNTNAQQAINLGKLNRFYPGVLLLVGGEYSSEQYVLDMVRANRAKNVTGECFFFYEGLSNRANVFKALYPGKANFPTFK